MAWTLLKKLFKYFQRLIQIFPIKLDKGYNVPYLSHIGKMGVLRLEFMYQFIPSMMEGFS